MAVVASLDVLLTAQTAAFEKGLKKAQSQLLGFRDGLGKIQAGTAGLRQIVTIFRQFESVTKNAANNILQAAEAGKHFSEKQISDAKKIVAAWEEWGSAIDKVVLKTAPLVQFLAGGLAEAQRMVSGSEPVKFGPKKQGLGESVKQFVENRKKVTEAADKRLAEMQMAREKALKQAAMDRFNAIRDRVAELRKELSFEPVLSPMQKFLQMTAELNRLAEIGAVSFRERNRLISGAFAKTVGADIAAKREDFIRSAMDRLRSVRERIGELAQPERREFARPQTVQGISEGFAAFTQIRDEAARAAREEADRKRELDLLRRMERHLQNALLIAPAGLTGAGA